MEEVCLAAEGPIQVSDNHHVACGTCGFGECLDRLLYDLVWFAARVGEQLGESITSVHLSDLGETSDQGIESDPITKLEIGITSQLSGCDSVLDEPVSAYPFRSRYDDWTISREVACHCLKRLFSSDELEAWHILVLGLFLGLQDVGRGFGALGSW